MMAAAGAVVLASARIGSAQGAQPAGQAQPSAKPATAQEVMQKTLAAYSAAKTYQGSWSYTLEQGEGQTKQVQKMVIDVTSRAPNHLAFRVAPAPGQKPLPDGQPLPELRVIVDGQTAWFENTSDKSFYKVALPKNAAISPLMFMPLIPSASQVERKEDVQADGKTLIVLAAATQQGGVGRMEIDASNYHIRRVSTEALVGLTKVSSAITMDKETFDGAVPDNAFAWKPARGLKEMPAPPEAAALFGPPDPGK